MVIGNRNPDRHVPGTSICGPEEAIAMPQLMRAGHYLIAVLLPIFFGEVWPGRDELKPVAAYLFILCIAVVARYFGFRPALACSAASAVMLFVDVLSTTRHGPLVQSMRLLLFLAASTFIASVTRHKSKEVAPSEQRRRALFECAIDAIMLFDDEGHAIDANPAAAELAGLSREELLKRSIDDFSHPDGEQDVRQLFARLLAVGKLQGEWTFVRGDGTVRHTEYRSVANILPGVHCMISHDITQRKEAERSLEQLSHRLLQSQDEERRRIARQLHETTAQTLAAIRLSLARVMRSPLANDPAAKQDVEETVGLTEQAITEIRTLSYLLHPPMIDEAGLLPALRWYVNGFEKRSGVTAVLDAPDDLGRLPSELETALFRIVQEALTNIQRHSGSGIARISLRRQDHRLRLTVEDEGRGLPPELRNDRSALRAAGVGIAGIEQRVRELGGQLELDSREGCTTLRVTVPVA